MNDDFRDWLRALSDADARFLVVGAYAVGVHGHPRATKDIDVWVEPSAENAPRVIAAISAFGAPLMGLTAHDLESVGIGFQMGLPPRRIDVLTKISGVAFADAWPRRLEVAFAEGLRCPVISREDLLANKRAAARPQDIADVAALERLARATERRR